MSASAADWKTAIRTVPVTVVSDAARSVSACSSRSPAAGRVGHQDFGLGRELHPAAGLAQEFYAGLLLKEGQLLGY